jgi:uncharacterized protein YndB with AHSA1/START domain
MKILALFALTLASPAVAEVVSASPNGFEVRETIPLVVSPEEAYRALSNLPAWWDPKHTYSGNAENLSLNLSPGGCFCERMPESGGGIEHLRVTYVDPGKRILFTGALGPLLFEAVAGVMDIQVKQAGSGSLVTLDYKASGFAKGNADKLAPVVDQVLGGQMKRLRSYATAQPKT